MGRQASNLIYIISKYRIIGGDYIIMKDIEGFEGRYAITDDGQVWSYLSNQFLKLHEQGYNNSYYTVGLYSKEGKT